MEVNSIPDIFQSKLRIAIVSCLITGTKSFKEIKSVTGATDGNISTQMKKLKLSGYVEVLKDYKDNKPRTQYTLTKLGSDEFEGYVKKLEDILLNLKK